MKQYCWQKTVWHFPIKPNTHLLSYSWACTPYQIFKFMSTPMNVHSSFIHKSQTQETTQTCLLNKQIMVYLYNNTVLPLWLCGEESTCNAEELGSVPGSRRSPGEGNDNPLQYCCLENPMDREVWRATVHGVAKSWIQLSD